MRFSAGDPGSGRDQASVLVATEAAPLWPRVVRTTATVEKALRWPVFVLVLSERPRADIPSAAPLLDLVDQRQEGDKPDVIPTRCRWSVVDNRNAVLRADVSAQAPMRFAAEILLPSRRVLGVLDIAARGATIGVTTARHTGRLSGRADIDAALQKVVLLDCGPSTDLARIADLLQRTVRVE